MTANDFVTIGVAFLLIAVLTVIGFYVMRKLREKFFGDDSSGGEDLLDFEEIHAEGDITAEEFREIKTALATRWTSGDSPSAKNSKSG